MSARPAWYDHAVVQRMHGQVEWAVVNGRRARVIRDVEQLVTLESWRLRWSQSLGAWLYFPPSSDRVS